jgi:hypothetical protein
MKSAIFSLFIFFVNFSLAQTVLAYNKRVKRFTFLGDIGIQSTGCFKSINKNIEISGRSSFYFGLNLSIPFYQNKNNEVGLQMFFYEGYYLPTPIYSSNLLCKEIGSYLYFRYRSGTDFFRSVYIGLKNREFDYSDYPSIAISYHKSISDNFLKYNLNFCLFKVYDHQNFIYLNRKALSLELGVSYIFPIYSFKSIKRIK